jgi:hypothetical protein
VALALGVDSLLALRRRRLYTRPAPAG